MNNRTAFPKCKLCHMKIYDDVDKLFDHLEVDEKIDINSEENKELDSTAICEKYFDYTMK